MNERLKSNPEAARVLMARGQSARTVLEDELFRSTVDALEKRIVQSWKDGKELKDREAAHARLLALASILEDLKAIMQTGELAKKLSEPPKTRS